MRVAFVTPSISRIAGGIFEIERCLAEQLIRKSEIDLRVLGVADQFSDADRDSWWPVEPSTFPSMGPGAFAYAPQLRRALERWQPDIVHLHALWMYTSVATASWSGRRRRPYVVTPNGMLEPWALGNGALKKRLALLLYEWRMLRAAAVLQANTEKELNDIRAFGLSNPVAIIPNGVEVPEPIAASPPWRDVLPAEGKKLLYVGRFHPKKGLANLLSAWQGLRRQSPGATNGWSLVLAGWNQGGHEQQLKHCAKQLGIESDVYFAGPLFGDAKASAYANADGCVLPSLSEGLPMMVLEAWAYGKPVLMTHQCNLPEGFDVGAAIKAQPEKGSLTKGLSELLGASDADRIEMGRRGLELVKRKFTWSKVADDMYQVYRWLVGGGSSPSCIVDS
jgi:poly(glycerol-phosphate) alpha-glucosyltransferase